MLLEGLLSGLVRRLARRLSARVLPAGLVSGLVSAAGTEVLLQHRGLVRVQYKDKREARRLSVH